MRCIKPTRHFPTMAAGLSASTVLWCALAAPPASAQRSDPVEDFKQLLKGNVNPDVPAQLKQREETLLEGTKKLHSPNDLRQVLNLTEWKDNRNLSVSLTEVDQKVRGVVGSKLDVIIHDAVERGDSTRQLAAANLVGEMGATIRAISPTDLNGFGRSLAPHVIRLITNPNTDPLVRQAAARSLGKINAEPKSAVAALKSMLVDPKSSDKDRRVATEALTDMARELLKLQKQGRPGGDILITRADVMACASEVIPIAALGLKDNDALVRRHSMDAIVQATNALNDLVPDPIKAEDLPPTGVPWTKDEIEKMKVFRADLAIEAGQFGPVIAALQDQGPRLAERLGDSDQETRVLARRALEYTGSARLKLVRRQESLPLEPGVNPPAKATNDPLKSVLAPGVLRIKDFAADPDPRVRRATMEFLEFIEDAAIPAHSTLVGALKDNDRFIRWAAVRTLGKIGVVKDEPAKTDSAVIGIAALLNPNEDPDVRAVAATSLRRFGKSARLALPQLIKMLNVGEADAQEEVIKAIIAAGPDNKDPVKPLIKSLDARSPTVRKLAADALGGMGPLAIEAIPALRDHSDDDDNAVRTAISAAILNIARN